LMKRSVNTVVTALILLLVYLLYTGVFSLTEFLVGAAVVLIVSQIFLKDLISETRKLSVVRFASLVAYIFKYFTIVEAVAHWNVVRAILTSKPRLNPAIVRVPYELRNEYSVVMVANSITNTPGTVVLDVDEASKTLYVHWLFADVFEDSEVKKKVSEELEHWAKLVFEG